MNWKHTAVMIGLMTVITVPNISEATIYTDRPSYQPCSIYSELTEENISTAKRLYNRNYKYECWKFIIKNTPDGVLGPGPFQWLRKDQIKLIRKAEDGFEDHWGHIMKTLHGDEWWKRMDEVLEHYK